ncbi:MAG: hypothetical protein IKI95_09060 [Clostridia bacterium]|nr:hypothetical protein [Clostridia bacterium]
MNNKIKLTMEQIKTLENVFNWALNLIEEESQKEYVLFVSKDGLFEKFDTEKETQKINDLFDFFRDHIEIDKNGDK